MSLILISSPADKNMKLGTWPRNLNAPRIDHIELAKRLEAQIAGLEPPDTYWHRGVHKLEKQIKLCFHPSLFALNQVTPQSYLFSTSEKTGIPLAFLLTIKRLPTPHVMVAHKLSSRSKTFLFRVSKLQKQFDHIVCVCRSQAKYAVEELGVDQSKVNFVYDKVDHHFFSPVQESADDYIMAVGQEQRDYKTLIQAVSGTNIKVLIVKSSPWSHNHTRFSLAENVKVLSNLTYLELKQLYAGARIVVVPLYNVNYAAGVNTILESMAMAKPVIASRSLGISDYIVENETGCYVTPQDVNELRQTILNLWEKPNERTRLGLNARQAVETKMNLDLYIDKVVQIMQ